MLRVTIEMVPRGDESKKYHMGTVEVANDGMGTAERGNYKVRLAGFKNASSRWRTGAVLDFPRKSRGPYDLLLRALAATVGDRAKRLVADLEADWWAERRPMFYTVLCENPLQGGTLALPAYSSDTESGVLDLVLAGARREGFQGKAQERMAELGWRVGRVFA